MNHNVKYQTMFKSFLVITLLLFSLPLVAADVIFYNDFTGDSDVPTNGSVGYVTEYETSSSNVTQINGTLYFNDQDSGGSTGIRALYSDPVSDSFWVKWTYTVDSISIAGIGASNCTSQLGLDENCPDGGQEIWDNNFINFGSSNVRIYSNTQVCSWNTGQTYEYAALHNFTSNVATVYQDGVLCGAQQVDPPSHQIVQSTGIVVLSGSGDVTTFQMGDLCVYTDDLGNETFDCDAYLNPPVVPVEVEELPLQGVGDIVGMALLLFVIFAFAFGGKK